MCILSLWQRRLTSISPKKINELYLVELSGFGSHLDSSSSQRKNNRYKPKFVLLMETLASREKTTFWCKKLGSNWKHLVVPMVGRSGDMALLWDKELSVNILYVDSWIIHISFFDVNTSSLIYFLVFMLVLI